MDQPQISSRFDGVRQVYKASACVLATIGVEKALEAQEGFLEPDLEDARLD